MNWFNLLLLPIMAAWLYTLSVIIHNYWSSYSSYGRTAELFNQELRNKEQDFFALSRDTGWLAQVLDGNQSFETVMSHKQRPYQFFLYSNSGSGSSKPIYWNSNEVQPAAITKATINGSLLNAGNGYYERIFQTINFRNKQYTLLGLFQLYRQYRIENANLIATFAGNPRLDRYFKFQESKTPYAVKNFDGKAIAYLKPLQAKTPYTTTIVEFLLQLASIIVVLYFLSQLWLKFIRNGKYEIGFAGIVGTWFLLCFVLPPISVYLDWESLLRTNNNFVESSTYYLIDLVYVSTLSLWWLIILSFEWRILAESVQQLHKKMQWIIAGLLVLTGLLIQFAVIKSSYFLYLDLGIAFDVTNFFSLDYTTLLGFAFLFTALSVHLLYYTMVTPLLVKIANDNKLSVLAIFSAVGLLILSTNITHPASNILLLSLLWLLAILFGLIRFPMSYSPVRTSKVIMWLFVYSLSFGLLLSFLTGDRLISKTKELSKGLILQQDKSSEYLIRVASVKLRRVDWETYYAYGYKKENFADANDSLTRQYFGGYLDKYATQLFVFDNDNRSVNVVSGTNYETLNLLFNSSRRDADYSWLASYKESYDRFGYIIKITAYKQDSTRLGTVFCVTRSVLPMRGEFAPEFLRQLIDINTDWPRGFSYAWYADGILVDQYRSYPFPSKISGDIMKGKDETGISKENSFEWWQAVPPNNLLVVAANKTFLIGFVSLVSYLFSTFLVLFAMFRLGAWFIPTGRGRKRFFHPFSYSMQNRLRITIVVILLASFFVIALITINFFINQYTDNNEQELSGRISAVSKQLQDQLPDNFIGYSNAGKQRYLGQNLRSLLGSNEYDVNVFDTAGSLLASTQDVLFAREILAELINPSAFWFLKNGETFRYFNNEEIGSLQFLSIYQPLLDKKNRLIGYVQIPFFASNNVLREDIAGFVVVLVNVIAFVFLLSGFIALLASGNITKSLNLVAEKMNRINLSGENERIEWQGDDEIGLLVAQYNKTVAELESSARLLAKNEREMAWREMAKQVAHEIKNPLTPMKLSLQFLQKAFQAGDPKAEELALKVSQNLVDQIDHLSRIAFDFSQFANIGLARHEAVNVHKVLQSIIPLYQLQNGVEITCELVNVDYLIWADATQINRLFTNLLQNAVEACQDLDDAQINISEQYTGNKSAIQIDIADNGPGIADDVLPDIFKPNFTTKTSGTGLGLAICRAIVERSEGTIEVQRMVDGGAKFTIRLPIIQPA